MEHKLRIKRFQEDLNELNQPDVFFYTLFKSAVEIAESHSQEDAFDD